MNDPRIINPLIIANWLYNDCGTLGGTTIQSSELEETWTVILDPTIGLIGDLPEIPILADVKRAYELLGAFVV